jgi:hypothetical protein
MREVLLDESMTVSELADALEASAATVVGVAFRNVGLMTTIHERLTFAQASTIAAELGFVARKKGDQAEG